MSNLNTNIPKHWQLKKLGEVCKLKNGYAFKSDKYENTGIPVIRISDINGGIVSSQKVVRVKASEEYENYLVEDNDILIAMSGATTGKFGIYKSTEKAYQNQRVGKFKILDEEILNNEFLYHQINSLKRQIEKDAYGGAQPNISSTKIEQMQVVVPPLPEQQAIVAKIEELLSELENGKQQLLTAQQQLKVYRQSLLKWAFEGKLTNNNVKEGELPKGWKNVKIIDIVEKGKHSLKAGPFGSSLKKEYYVQKGYKIYGQEQVISDNAFLGDYYINEDKYQELKSCKVKPYDILVSLVGTVGKVLILPKNCQEGVINPRLIKITLDGEIYLHKFFKYYFESSYVKNFYSAKAQGTTMDVLNLGIIKTIPFPLPSLKEQQLIVSELESKLTVCDKIEETISQSLQHAETLKQSVLKKAFEGKLVSFQQNHTMAAEPQTIYNTK